MFEQIADQAERVASVIGAIAVYQDVDICFNIGKHPPHDVALALHLLMADDRARGPSDRDSAIFRVVVVEVDARIWQGFAKRPHHGAYPAFLIETGDEDCNFDCTPLPRSRRFPRRPQGVLWDSHHVPFKGGLHRPNPEFNFGFYVEPISIRYKKP